MFLTRLLFLHRRLGECAKCNAKKPNRKIYGKKKYSALSESPSVSVFNKRHMNIVRWTEMCIIIRKLIEYRFVDVFSLNTTYNHFDSSSYFGFLTENTYWIRNRTMFTINTVRIHSNCCLEKKWKLKFKQKWVRMRAYAFAVHFFQDLFEKIERNIGVKLSVCVLLCLDCAKLLLNNASSKSSSFFASSFSIALLFFIYLSFFVLFLTACNGW